KQRGGGVFVLVKTSNPGGGLFQDLVADSSPLYRHVANYVEGRAAESLADTTLDWESHAAEIAGRTTEKMMTGIVGVAIIGLWAYFA
ncbi:MAG: hypothetical protein QGG24_10345, partial [Vicinamibacterales bacterium]|nr:hypothetical protein [Vicinamibacterales bacterium]